MRWLVIQVCVLSTACGDYGTHDPVTSDAVVAPDAAGCRQTFQATPLLATGGGFGIAAADVDGDADLDLVSSHGGGAIAIIRNRGDASFELSEITGAYPRAVVLGRFDQDAHVDIAVTDASDVAIWLGHGDGTFEMPVRYATDSAAGALVAADFNRDEILDLATANGSSASMNVLIGVGDGTFAPAVSYPTDVTPTSLAVGNLDLDGFLDIAVATQGTIGSLSLFRGNGDGTFMKQADLPAVNNGSAAPYGVAIADVDADGSADLLFSDANLGVGVKRGRSDFVFHPTVAFSTGNAAMGLAVADMNLDGKLDVLAGSTPGVAYLAGNGDGTFAAPSITTTGPDVRTLAVGDFDDDGHPDVATNANFSPSVHLLRGACSNE